MCFNKVRGSYSGNTSDFQSDADSSILLPRSRFNNNLKGTTMIRSKFSRGPDIDTNKCVDMIGNRYDLILVAAIRSREIARQHRHSEAKHHIYPGVTALLEIQNGEIGAEYLKRIR